MPGRKRVLWVDDEIEFLRSHIMFLETRGYSVIPVFSGDDAIHLIKEDTAGFDIVLLDEQMPGKDGLTTLEEIKDMYPDLPVVMVTKSEEERVMEDALGKKIDGYLTKPVNPSQILLMCKRLLDSKQIISSQIKQRFVRSYSEIKTRLANRLGTQQWIKFYEELVKWDLELENIDDEGFRQTHAGQKSDSNAAFSDFIMENYAQWVKGQGEPPLLSTKVIETQVVPVVKEHKRVVMIVMSGMRLDQYTDIESVLRQFYSVKRNYFYSILPSSTSFSRPALFPGRFPSEIFQSVKGIWKTGREEEEHTGSFEQKLLTQNLDRFGVKTGRALLYVKLTDAGDVQSVLGELNEDKQGRLAVIVVNFVTLLTRNRSTSTLLQEIAPDENAFRSLTRSWFQHSSLMQLLRELARLDYVVMLTSDHGSILCSRGTEVYGIPDLGTNLRFRFGEAITADERRAINLSDPMHFRLPRFTDATNCIIAKENYYFIHPDKFEYYQKQYQNSFQQGGISMEEMIMPIGTFTPLGT